MELKLNRNIGYRNSVSAESMYKKIWYVCTYVYARVYTYIENNKNNKTIVLKNEQNIR